MAVVCFNGNTVFWAAAFLLPLTGASSPGEIIVIRSIDADIPQPEPHYETRVYFVQAYSANSIGHQRPWSPDPPGAVVHDDAWTPLVVFGGSPARRTPPKAPPHPAPPPPEAFPPEVTGPPDVTRNQTTTENGGGTEQTTSAPDESRADTDTLIEAAFRNATNQFSQKMVTSPRVVMGGIGRKKRTHS